MLIEAHSAAGWSGAGGGSSVATAAADWSSSGRPTSASPTLTGVVARAIHSEIWAGESPSEAGI
jgi:hypothetical protein